MLGDMIQINKQRGWLQDKVKKTKKKFSHSTKSEMVKEIIKHYGIKIRCNLIGTSFSSIIVPKNPNVINDFRGATIFINSHVNNLPLHNKECKKKETVLHEIGHVIANHKFNFFPAPAKAKTTSDGITDQCIISYMAQSDKNQTVEIQADLLGIYLSISPFEDFLKNVWENKFDLKETRKEYKLSIDCLAKIIMFILSSFPLHYFKYNVKKKEIENNTLSSGINWSLVNISQNSDLAAHKCLKHKKHSTSKVDIQGVNIVCKAFYEKEITGPGIFIRDEKMTVIGYQKPKDIFDIEAVLKLPKTHIKSILCNTCP